MPGDSARRVRRRSGRGSPPVRSSIGQASRADGRRCSRQSAAGRFDRRPRSSFGRRTPTRRYVRARERDGERRSQRPLSLRGPVSRVVRGPSPHMPPTRRRPPVMRSSSPVRARSAAPDEAPFVSCWFRPPSRALGPAERRRAVSVHADAGDRQRSRVSEAAVARILLSPPHLSGRERELVAEAIDSNWIAPLGPQVDAFEAEFAVVAGVEHAVALSSGTAALHLALVVLGIGPATRSRARASRSPRARTRSRTRARRRSSSTRTRRPGRSTSTCSSGRSPSDARPARASAPCVAVDLYGQCCDYDALRELCDAPRRPARPGRGRVARRHLPRRAGRAARARSRRSRSTGTRSSRRAAAGCSSRTNGELGRARAQALDAGARAGRRTTSTSRSGSTTG